RQGRTGVPLRVCRGPDRTRHAAHPLRAVAGLRHDLLYRILRDGPAYDPGRGVRGCNRCVHGGRKHPPLQREEHGARHRRLWSRLLLVHLGAHVHRGR
ncbi:unnamed protein product, partial [Ectocarpus fasciculatus]